jgi:hypothetical protein
MSAHYEARVARALIHHFYIQSHERFRELRLKEDLGLEPLDLVLFVLDLEHTNDPPFDYAALDGATTVGELVTLVAAWFRVCDDARREQAVDRVA